MTNETVLLVDLSSMAVPIYMTSTANPNPDWTSERVIERVHELAWKYPHVALCCDAGKSFRHSLTPTYKATRPESEAALHHQIRLSVTKLQEAGFACWAVPGFEADDLVASATRKALERGLDVLIVTADKDLLQLVGPRVRVLNPRQGAPVMDEAAVEAKYGVRPAQMRDFLTLVGDKSDNIAGAAGIGEVKARDLLRRFGSLDALYRQLQSRDAATLAIAPATAASLEAFREKLPLTRRLIELREDVVEFSFDELLGDRPAPPMETAAQTESECPVPVAGGAGTQPEPSGVDAVKAESEVLAGLPEAGPPPLPETALTRREPVAIVENYERQLDPCNLDQAKRLALDMYNSHMFSGYGSPQAVLSTILTGRELGIPAMASLRGIHNIEGKHSLSASLMVALVLRSGLVEYFRPVKISADEAIFEAKRYGQPPVTLSHTLDMAVQAGLVKPDSGWVKVPTDMLVARCSARLARLICPDVLFGLYTPEELQEVHESRGRG